MENELLLAKKTAHLFPSFSAKKRFEQLRFALENKDSKAIWCVRGGYGSADLIPFLQKMAKPLANKMFIGFSDITSLGIFLQQNWNQKIIYGPMLTQLAFDKVEAKSKKAILDVVFGKKTQLKYELENLSGKTSFNLENTEIVGGCLSVISANFSTSNQINWDNKILFLEDIDEGGEKLDRYFKQLIQAMIFSKKFPQAILLGNYAQGVKVTAKKKNISLAIKNFAQNLKENSLNIPLFQEKTNCLGHAKNIMPLVIGGEAKISKNSLNQEICLYFLAKEI